MTHSVKLYDSASTLTLDRFISCAVDGNLKQLQINPLDEFLEEYLITIWESIYEQFLDGMENREGIHVYKLHGKINYLNFTYKLIHLCVKYLQMAYDPEILDLLKPHIRVTGQFNPDDKPSYFQDLQVILNRAQRMLLDIENKKAELAVIEKRQKPAEKATRKQFDQLIAQVSIYAKFHIDKKIVTVSEFIEYYVARKQNYEALEEQYEKSKIK